MSEIIKDYRPSNIIFDVAIDDSEKENLGHFDSHEDVKEFLKKAVTVNEAITVMRHLDIAETQELRKKCVDLLENKLPYIAVELSTAEKELKDIKAKVKDLQSQYDGTDSEIKATANISKRGTTDMSLGSEFTYNMAYKGKILTYSYIDNELKLCHVREVREDEAENLFQNQLSNKEFFEAIFFKNE